MTHEGQTPLEGTTDSAEGVIDPTRVTKFNPLGDPDLTFDGRPRCNATSQQNNRRCERAKTPGTTVCATHGSRAPQVKRKAALRMIELVDPAIATLARVMTNPASKDADKIRAAENVLDRAGLPRRVETGDPEQAKELLVARLIAMREQQEQEQERQEIAAEDVPQIVAGTIEENTADE